MHLDGSYVDVVAQIKFIVNQYGAQLTIDERNLLSIAYKNLTNSLRNSWRILDSVEKLQQMKNQVSPRLKQEMNLVRRQREKIEKELADVCKDIVNLLDRQLLPAATAGEETVFYSKMYVFNSEVSDASRCSSGTYA
jgi:14-3-3 protein epsilon